MAGDGCRCLWERAPQEAGSAATTGGIQTTREHLDMCGGLPWQPARGIADDARDLAQGHLNPQRPPPALLRKGATTSHADRKQEQTPTGAWWTSTCVLTYHVHRLAF